MSRSSIPPRILRLSLALLLVLATAAPGRAGTVVIGFDSDTSGFPSIYDGFNWNALGIFNADPYNGQPGYGQALLSLNNIAVSDDVVESSFTSSTNTPFTFVSGNFASGFNDGLTIEVAGINAANQMVGQTTLALSTSGPTFATFNYADIVQVTFTVIDPGTLTSSILPYGGYGAQFGMDNLVISFGDAVSTPEPSTAVLAIFGTAGFSLFRVVRRRRSAVPAPAAVIA